MRKLALLAGMALLAAGPAWADYDPRLGTSGSGLAPANNLSDVTSPTQALVNLGAMPVAGGTFTGAVNQTGSGGYSSLGTSQFGKSIIGTNTQAGAHLQINTATGSSADLALMVAGVAQDTFGFNTTTMDFNWITSAGVSMDMKKGAYDTWWYGGNGSPKYTGSHAYIFGDLSAATSAIGLNGENVNGAFTVETNENDTPVPPVSVGATDDALGESSLATASTISHLMANGNVGMYLNLSWTSNGSGASTVHYTGGACTTIPLLNATTKAPNDGTKLLSDGATAQPALPNDGRQANPLAGHSTCTGVADATYNAIMANLATAAIGPPIVEMGNYAPGQVQAIVQEQLTAEGALPQIAVINGGAFGNSAAYTQATYGTLNAAGLPVWKALADQLHAQGIPILALVRSPNTSACSLTTNNEPLNWNLKTGTAASTGVYYYEKQAAIYGHGLALDIPMNLYSGNATCRGYYVSFIQQQMAWAYQNGVPVVWVLSPSPSSDANFVADVLAQVVQIETPPAGNTLPAQAYWPIHIAIENYQDGTTPVMGSDTDANSLTAAALNISNALIAGTIHTMPMAYYHNIVGGLTVDAAHIVNGQVDTLAVNSALTVPSLSTSDNSNNAVYSSWVNAWLPTGLAADLPSNNGAISGTAICAYLAGTACTTTSANVAFTIDPSSYQVTFKHTTNFNNVTMNVSGGAISGSPGATLGATTATTLRATGGTVNAQTASYTIASGDCGSTITENSASATVVTMPTGLAVGCRVVVKQKGTGAVSVTNGANEVLGYYNATAATSSASTTTAGSISIPVPGQYAGLVIANDTTTSAQVTGGQ